MAVFQILFTFLFLFLLVTSSRYTKRDKQLLFQKIEALKAKAERLYGDARNEPVKLWEYELEDRLSYPRGNKRKLHEISQQWLDYYACSARVLSTLTSARALPAASTTVYHGAVARVRCGACIAPDERNQVRWMYAESLKNLTFQQIQDKETYIMSEDLLTIYRATREDTGVYKCEVNGNSAGVTVLEVVDDEENYTAVKPPTSHGPYAAPPVKDNELIIFSKWSPWSECSRCGHWGRKRRHGMCHVKLRDQRMRQRKHKMTRTTETNGTTTLCKEGYTFLQAFPEGFRCQSPWLPPCVAERTAVRDRPNEIMIAMCKPACEKEVVFRVLSSSGAVLEQANNTAGIFSLIQRPPPQVAPPAQVLFAVKGQPVVISCPGTTLRDVPVTWRVDRSDVWERSLQQSSGGRVRVDARDRLLIADVWPSDAAVYSCWQRSTLAGQAKLVVWSGGWALARRGAALLALLYVVCLLCTAHS